MIPLLKRTSYIEQVVREHMYLEWSDLEPELGRVLKKGVGSHNEEDVLLELLSGQKQLWRMFGENEFKGYMITEVFNAPRIRICKIVYVVGRDRAAMLKSLDQLVQWAKRQGCDKLLFNGRRGWMADKAIKSEFEVGGVLFMKDLNDER